MSRPCVAGWIVTELELPFRTSTCPVCAATDAFVEAVRDGDEYYVECANCRVYRASRRAFRHLEYLRQKADAESLARLDKLAARLRSRARGATVQLEYDTWQSFLD